MKTLTKAALDDIALQEGRVPWVECITLTSRRPNPWKDWGYSNSLDDMRLELIAADVLDTAGQGTFDIFDAVFNHVNTWHYCFCNSEVPCVMPQKTLRENGLLDIGSIGEFTIGPYAESFVPGGELTPMTCEFGRLFHPVPYDRDCTSESKEVTTMSVTIGDQDGRIAPLLLDQSFAAIAPNLEDVTVSRHMVLPGVRAGNTVSAQTYSGIPVDEMRAAAAMHEDTSCVLWPDKTYVISEPIVSFRYRALGLTLNAGALTVQLKPYVPFDDSFPPRDIRKTTCRWGFCSPECGLDPVNYEGMSCDKTIRSCAEYSNTYRFGAFPGCGVGGLTK